MALTLHSGASQNELAKSSMVRLNMEPFFNALLLDRLPKFLTEMEGEHTRPRVSFSAPSPKTRPAGYVATPFAGGGKGNTRGRVWSPNPIFRIVVDLRRGAAIRGNKKPMCQ